MTMTGDIKVKYPHLQLVEWPFQTAPDDNFYSFMADRTQVVEDVNGILRSLSRRNTSTIHLIWAWFGAGKTHTLRHIEYLCKWQHTGLFPVYTEMPKAFRSFSDLYRSFASAFDFDVVRDSFLEVMTGASSGIVANELRRGSLDMFNAVSLLCTGDDQQQEGVLRWLHGENLPVSELRPLGIGRRISRPEDAINAIAWIVKILHTGAALTETGMGRIIWMIDEFQQISASKPVAREVNNCLHSIFNRCPNSLSLFISFSGRPEKGYPSWLSPELADRIGVQRVVLLPPLSREEAKIFVQDALNHFRPESVTDSPGFFPFEENTVDMILDLIDEDRHEIRPRSVMQYFTSVLEIADPLLEAGRMKTIEGGFARKCLEGRLMEDPTE